MTRTLRARTAPVPEQVRALSCVKGDRLETFVRAAGLGPEHLARLDAPHVMRLVRYLEEQPGVRVAAVSGRMHGNVPDAVFIDEAANFKRSELARLAWQTMRVSLLDDLTRGAAACVQRTKEVWK